MSHASSHPQFPPPDRSRVPTEQRNPRSMRLHEMSIDEIVALINDEDRSVADAVATARRAINCFLVDAEPRWLTGGRLIYLGAGTSGRLGVLDASECPPTFQTPPQRVVGIIAGGDPALRKSSEGMEDDPRGAVGELAALGLNRNDILVAIASGGTTPYALGALEWSKSLPQPPLTALLTCSPMARPPYADHLLCIETGPEVVTGSTRMKAGTATKLVLNTISTTLMIREGRVFENLMVDLRATNAKLRDRAARIVSTLTGISRDQAFATIDDAGGSVKSAIVMVRCGLSRAAAERRLADAKGRLHDALRPASV